MTPTKLHSEVIVLELSQDRIATTIEYFTFLKVYFLLKMTCFATPVMSTELYTLLGELVHCFQVCSPQGPYLN